MTNAQAAQVAAKEELGIIPSYKEVGLGGAFANKVVKRQEIKARIEELKAELDELNGYVEVELAKADLKAVTCGRFRVTLVDSSNSSLSKEKLLEAGVEAEVIVACTVTKEYSYVQITDTEKSKTARREKKLGAIPITKGKGKKKAAR